MCVSACVCVCLCVCLLVALFVLYSLGGGRGLAPRPFHLAAAYGLDVWLMGPRAKDYHYGQEWGYEAGKGNMWAPQVVEDAKACAEGLKKTCSRA